MEYENIKNRIQELSTYTSDDNRTVRKLCVFKGKKIIECDELYAVENVLNELERLQKEFEAVDNECSRLEKKEIELENALNSEKTVQNCLHCGKDTPLYCEKCYQELITKNGELQLENKELIKEVNEENKRCMMLAIEKQDLIENYIPKQVIRNKIELFTKQAEKFEENKCQWTNGGVIDLLKEILGDE